MSLELEVTKLQPKRGDTIVVRYPTDLEQRQVSALIRSCGYIMDQTGALVVMVPKSIEVAIDPDYKPGSPRLPVKGKK
jgi:hypothetical protein